MRSCDETFMNVPFTENIIKSVIYMPFDFFIFFCNTRLMILYAIFCLNFCLKLYLCIYIRFEFFYLYGDVRLVDGSFSSTFSSHFFFCRSNGVSACSISRINHQFQVIFFLTQTFL